MADVVSRLHAQTENFPGHDAFASSAIALLRLQDVYKLSTDNISNGRIGDGFSSLLMTGRPIELLFNYTFKGRPSSKFNTIFCCLTIGNACYLHAKTYLDGTKSL